MKSRLPIAVCGLVLIHSSGAPAHGVESGRRLHFNVGIVETSSLNNLRASATGPFQSDKTYILQLDGPMTSDREDLIRKAGVVLGEYIPDFSYVVILSGASKEQLERLDFVICIGEFRKEWKLDPELGHRASRLMQRKAMARRGEVAVLVSLFEGRGSGSVLKFLQSVSAAKLHWMSANGPGLILFLTMPLADARRLADLDDVHYVEEMPEITVRNVSTRWILQSNNANNTPLYNAGITGTGQIVGIMDTAVSLDHCSFRDPVNNTPGASHRKVVGYEAVPDYDPHGTHIACTIVGQDFNGATDDTRGVAYGGRLMYLPIPFSGDPSNPVYETDYYNAAVDAHGYGARIHNTSWGNDLTANYDGLCRGIDRFSYDYEDDLVIVAETPSEPTLKNPENAKNSLAIGATYDAPNQDQFCNGGSGPTADGRRKPELFAPGCGIVSATGAGQVCTTGTYVPDGTSQAAAAISGAGLLVRQYFVDGYYPTGTATPANVLYPSGALVKAMLLNSASNTTGAGSYPNNQTGWGKVILNSAVYLPASSRKLLVLSDKRNASGLSTTQVDQYYMNVSSSAQPLRVTLVWTDPAASASTGTASASINDLDLEITAPNSNFFRGNYFLNGTSAPNGSKDAINNVEQIHINPPWIGVWTVRVRAAAVNQGRQGYALIATGQVGAPPPPSISSINPTTWNSGLVLGGVTINGAGYFTTGGVAAWLRKSGQPIIPMTSMNVVNATRITGTFDLRTAEPGSWDVVVQNPDQQMGVLAGGFTVTLVCTKGDMNHDGVINGLDIQRFCDVLVHGGATPIERCAGDVENNPDGFIDEPDVPNFALCVLAGACLN